MMILRELLSKLHTDANVDITITLPTFRHSEELKVYSSEQKIARYDAAYRTFTIDEGFAKLLAEGNSLEYSDENIGFIKSLTDFILREGVGSLEVNGIYTNYEYGYGSDGKTEQVKSVSLKVEVSIDESEEWA
jgi:hypothetical protein